MVKQIRAGHEWTCMRTTLRVLDWLAQKAVIIGFCLPPWNLFWWGAGYVYYRLTGGERTDKNGAGGIIVVGLPGLVACLPFWLLRQAIERRAHARCIPRV